MQDDRSNVVPFITRLRAMLSELQRPSPHLVLAPRRRKRSTPGEFGRRKATKPPFRKQRARAKGKAQRIARRANRGC